MKLLKENSYEIVRLFINQVGITIFSLVLYTGLDFGMGKDSSHTVRIWLSVFATVFYLILLYNAGWEYGSKDKIKIDAGKMGAVRGKGVIMAIVANSLNFLFAIIGVVSMAIYFATEAAWLYTVFSVANLFLRFFCAMYLGIIQGIFSYLPANSNMDYFLETVGFGVMPLLAIAATQIGYLFGSKDIRIVNLFKSKPQGPTMGGRD